MTSRIETPDVEAATGASAEVFAQLKKAIGGVPNTFAAIGALNPAALQAVLAADGVLTAGTLGKKDLETIKLFVSEDAGCDYCVAAHSMLGKAAGLSPEALRQVRGGQPTGDAKRDALIRVVRILLRTAGTIDATEYEAIRLAGYTDAQLVEISLAIAVTVFTNVFNRINDTTLDFPAAA
jgi:AhpD family alkylhydroperoxidase